MEKIIEIAVKILIGVAIEFVVIFAAPHIKNWMTQNYYLKKYSQVLT